MTQAEKDAETTAIIAAAFDNTADSYERVGVEYFARFGAELVRRAAPRPGEAGLDLGCGRGHCLFPLAAAVGAGGSVTGTDISARMVSVCAAEAAERGLAHVRVQPGDASAPDFAPASFDVVTAGMVMFFVPAPRIALRTVASLLRPGGRFAMSSFGPSDAKFADAMAILYRHRTGPPWEEATDKPFDTPESIAAMLTEAGFADVELTELTHEVCLDSIEGYWAFLASQGSRILIDQLSAEQLPAARAEVEAMLEPHRDAAGRLVHHAVARFATGRVPPA